MAVVAEHTLLQKPIEMSCLTKAERQLWMKIVEKHIRESKILKPCGVGLLYASVQFL